MYNENNSERSEFVTPDPHAQMQNNALPDQTEDAQLHPARKKKRAARIIAALLVVAVLGGAVGTFSLFYEIQPGSGDTVFTISHRQSSGDSDQGPFRLSNGENASSDKQDETGNAQQNKSGTKMVIQSEPSQVSPSTLASSTGGELTIAQIAAKVTPSTVGVVSTIMSDYGTGTSTGTGIIMSKDGYIITNNHVIKGASSVKITLMNKKTYDAKLIGADSRSDLAVVKIEAQDLTPAEFGDSDALQVGELAVAIGNPLGLDLMGTVTDGIISAINRDVVVEERTMTLIQTNAAINAGNSGGPLINKYGQVIGINTLKMQDYYTSVEGLGFAIPTNTAKEIIDELINNGYIKGRPSIGITANRVITEAESKFYNIPQGVVIYYVNPNSDAYKQGLQVNDIVVKAQGEKIQSTEDINKIKEKCVAGDKFTLTVYRDGKYFDISFKLMDEAQMDNANSIPIVP